MQRERDEDRQMRREEREEARERRREEEELRSQRRREIRRQQLTAYQAPFQRQLPLIPPPPALPLQYQPPAYHVPAASHLSPPPQLIQHAALPIRSSSPISTVLEDGEVLNAFFQYKRRNARTAEGNQRWARVGDTVLAHDWSIADIRAMATGEGVMYQRAIAAGLADGIARRLITELRLYKPEHRRVEEAAGFHED